MLNRINVFAAGLLPHQRRTLKGILEDASSDYDNMFIDALKTPVEREQEQSQR